MNVTWVQFVFQFVFIWDVFSNIFRQCSQTLTYNKHRKSNWTYRDSIFIWYKIMASFPYFQLIWKAYGKLEGTYIWLKKAFLFCFIFFFFFKNFLPLGACAHPRDNERDSEKWPHSGIRTLLGVLSHSCSLSLLHVHGVKKL